MDKSGWSKNPLSILYRHRIIYQYIVRTQTILLIYRLQIKREKKHTRPGRSIMEVKKETS